MIIPISAMPTNLKPGRYVIEVVKGDGRTQGKFNPDTIWYRFIGKDKSEDLDDQLSRLRYPDRTGQ